MALEILCTTGGHPIPERINDLAEYIQERTTLNQEQYQEAASVFYEVDKSLWKVGSLREMIPI